MIISIKKPFRKRITAAAVIILVIAVTGALICFFGNNRKNENSGLAGCRVDNDSDALDIAGRCCNNVSPVPVNREEVTIPENWSEVYTEYQRIQQKAGFDLEPYRGRRCVKYSLIADAGDPQGGKEITLLVYSGTLIGGDISERRFDGGMYPLALL